MTKQAMIDLSQSFDDILERDDIVTAIRADMKYYPLCCSTGVLQNVQASKLQRRHQTMYEYPPALSKTKVDGIIRNVNKAKWLHEITRVMNETGIGGVPYPIKVAKWNAMSLIAAKCIVGLDDAPDDGYAGFKAAQVTFFDRIDADKDPALGFKFTYNRTWSCDHLMEWLMLPEQSHLGEVLISTPTVGAHGARVRGCIFTPDKGAVQEYHDERVEQLREHVIAVLEHRYTDKQEVEAKPGPTDAFVSY